MREQRNELWLLCLICALSAARAIAGEPAATAPAGTIPPATAPAAPSTATPAAPAYLKADSAPTDASADTSHEEKLLLAKGYRLTTRNGNKVYCRREPVLGSRLDYVERCGTLEQLKSVTETSRGFAEGIQRNQLNPTGR